MNRKPPELPNIEDATLRACLAPLMEAMNSGVETAASPGFAAAAGTSRIVAPAASRQGSRTSNDNPAPASGDDECSATPASLAEWRSRAEDEFGTFRTIELFLAMSDAELRRAAAEFPTQVGGTIRRIGRMKRRLQAQYDAVTIAAALLERALTRAGIDQPKAHGDTDRREH